MPLTSKGEEIKSAMEKQYGSNKGEEVFYASRNKGTITGVDALPETAEGVEPATPAEGVTVIGPTARASGDEMPEMEMMDAIGGAPDEIGDSYMPVTAMTHEQINERNRRYWEQPGGQFFENK